MFGFSSTDFALTHNTKRNDKYKFNFTKWKCIHKKLKSWLSPVRVRTRQYALLWNFCQNRSDFYRWNALIKSNCAHTLHKLFKTNSLNSESALPPEVGVIVGRVKWNALFPLRIHWIFHNVIFVFQSKTHFCLLLS